MSVASESSAQRRVVSLRFSAPSCRDQKAASPSPKKRSRVKGWFISP